jgi:hypothetical protein
MSSPTTVLPFEPLSMSPAQLAAVSYLARYSGRTHNLYAFQLRRWFSWCEDNPLDPLVRDPASARRALHSPARRIGADGLFSRHDDARDPRVLPVRSH